jgi:hypothetical protein
MISWRQFHIIYKQRTSLLYLVSLQGPLFESAIQLAAMGQATDTFLFKEFLRISPQVTSFVKNLSLL